MNQQIHSNDNETSEYGVGLKTGCMGIAGRCEVYTKVNNKYYYVDLDFKKMEKMDSVKIGRAHV